MTPSASDVVSKFAVKLVPDGVTTFLSVVPVLASVIHTCTDVASDGTVPLTPVGDDAFAMLTGPKAAMRGAGPGAAVSFVRCSVVVLVWPAGSIAVTASWIGPSASDVVFSVVE